MKSEFIDLGCGLDSPVSSMMEKNIPKKTYPCFSFSCDEAIDLPEGDFTFTAKGRKILHTEETRDPEDPRHRYEIEVHGFKPMDSAKKEAGMSSMADAFKKGLSKSMGSKMGESYSGPEEE